MLIKSQIKNIVEKTAQKTFGDILPANFDAQIGRSDEKIHGDYFTNAALRLAVILKKDPCEIAAQIGDQILAQKSEMISKVEVVHPGFLNIFLSEKFIQKQVSKILKQKSSRQTRGKKILIEFLSANPTGQLHLGHGRNAFWGDALANVLSKAGCIVKKEYYVNNAKASNQIKELGKTAVGEGETYLNDYLRQKLKVKSAKIKILSKKIKLQNSINCHSPDFRSRGNPDLINASLDPRLRGDDSLDCFDKDELYREAGTLIANDIQKDNKIFIEKNLKIKFDKWFLEESELYKNKSVDKMRRWLKINDLVYEKEGAEWLKMGQYGDSEDRVLVRSDEAHTPTYLLPDIAYHQNKIKRGFSHLINIWGADHQGHVKSMKVALKMLGFKGKFDILITQMVSLKEGAQKVKLSKREGNVVTLKSLINEVGMDSAKFFYLLKSLDTQMKLDMDLMKKQSSENPVFYVQYAHARICSILRKARITNYELRITKIHTEMLSTESELDLIKELFKFPELIEEISRDYQIHKLPHYAISLADRFHHFYHECRVISEDKLLTGARVALIEATKITLKNTLDLLGVGAPEKM